MSLLTDIAIKSDLTSAQCKSLMEDCRIGGLEAEPVKPRQSTHWQVWETGKGEFGEDMLLDDADWDAPHWRLHPAAATALAGILSHIMAASPLGVDFSMAWVGDKLDPIAVTPAQLLEIIRGGKIGTRTLYQARETS